MERKSLATWFVALAALAAALLTSEQALATRERGGSLSPAAARTTAPALEPAPSADLVEALPSEVADPAHEYDLFAGAPPSLLEPPPAGEYDDLGGVVAYEYDASGRLLWGEGGSPEVASSGRKSRIGVFLVLGSPLIAVRDAGTYRWHWGCESLGLGIASEIVQGAWTDPTTGIAYHRARWYDPRNASWLSEDPEGDIDSPNLYAYVGWGPESGVDPLGLARKTKNGGTNWLGDWGDETDSILGGIVMDTVGNTVSDMLGLDTIADSAIVAGDSSRGVGERAWAATKGIGVAALDVAGGEILGTAGKALLKIPGAKRGLAALAESSAGRVLSRDVGSFLTRSSAGLAEAAPRAAAKTRMAAIREALSDANGKLLPATERAGVKATIRAVEDEGYNLVGSVKYRGNQGIDLTFRGVEEGTFRFAFAEAKASTGLGSLEVDALGIRQGSYEFFRTRLARGIVYGDSGMTPLYREMYMALRSGDAELFAGFSGSDRLFRLDASIFGKNVNFRTTPSAATLVK